MAQKTRKSLAARFKVTGSGKLIRRSANRRHLLRAKSNKQKRLTGIDHVVARGQTRSLRCGMPHATNK